ncbi:MAG: hypothetical protein CVU21_06690 [Betaproteobacteria bacterium HGW-Betaproteobacteria-15]|nr:MAG: hypothetical protein CVU21_06690 [Betaproteobacteria bacterium HGW-Betaproteobacteria-15]
MLLASPRFVPDDALKVRHQRMQAHTIATQFAERHRVGASLREEGQIERKYLRCCEPHTSCHFSQTASGIHQHFQPMIEFATNRDLSSRHFKELMDSPRLLIVAGQSAFLAEVLPEFEHLLRLFDFLVASRQNSFDDVFRHSWPCLLRETLIESWDHRFHALSDNARRVSQAPLD